jgi:hypothetical protein
MNGTATRTRSARIASKVKGLLLAAVLLAPATASATDVGCVVKVVSVGLSPNGHVLASYTGGLGAFYLCYVGSSISVSGLGTVDADSCKAMYSTLLTAKSTQQNVLLKFTGVTNTNFCSTRNFVYEAPTSTPDYPYYVGLEP